MACYQNQIRQQRAVRHYKKEVLRESKSKRKEWASLNKTLATLQAKVRDVQAQIRDTKEEPPMTRLLRASDARLKVILKEREAMLGVMAKFADTSTVPALKRYSGDTFRCQKHLDAEALTKTKLSETALRHVLLIAAKNPKGWKEKGNKQKVKRYLTDQKVWKLVVASCGSEEKVWQLFNMA